MFTTFAIGNIVRDAELKEVNVENVPTPRCRFTIAINETKRSGKTATTFVECVAWREYAKKIAPWLLKGRQVHVEGKICINQYADTNNIIRTKLQMNDVEVTLLGQKPKTEVETMEEVKEVFEEPVTHSVETRVEEYNDDIFPW